MFKVQGHFCNRVIFRLTINTVLCNSIRSVLQRTKFNRKCTGCTSNKVDYKSSDIIPIGMLSLFDELSTSTTQLLFYINFKLKR